MRPHLLQDTTLRYFLAVAQSGSLTEASARLHVAASALSRQIAGLEAQLGTPLFERHARGMVLHMDGSRIGNAAAYLGTSLAAIVGFTELTRAGNIVSNQIFQPLLVFGIVGILYFLLCWPRSLYGSHLERRMAIAAR